MKRIILTALLIALISVVACTRPESGAQQSEISGLVPPAENGLNQGEFLPSIQDDDSILPESKAYSNPDTIFTDVTGGFYAAKDSFYAQIELAQSGAPAGRQRLLDELELMDLELSRLMKFDDAPFSAEEMTLARGGDRFKVHADGIIHFGTVEEFLDAAATPSIYLVNDKVYDIGTLNLDSGALAFEETIERGGQIVMKFKIELRVMDEQYIVRKVKYTSDANTVAIALSFNTDEFLAAVGTTGEREEDGFSIIGRGMVHIDDMLAGYDRIITLRCADDRVEWK